MPGLKKNDAITNGSPKDNPEKQNDFNPFYLNRMC